MGKGSGYGVRDGTIPSWVKEIFSPTKNSLKLNIQNITLCTCSNSFQDASFFGEGRWGVCHRVWGERPSAKKYTFIYIHICICLDIQYLTYIYMFVHLYIHRYIFNTHNLCRRAPIVSTKTLTHCDILKIRFWLM